MTTNVIQQDILIDGLILTVILIIMVNLFGDLVAGTSVVDGR